MVAYTWKPRAHETESGRMQFGASLGYMVKSYLQRKMPCSNCCVMSFETVLENFAHENRNYVYDVCMCTYMAWQYLNSLIQMLCAVIGD